MGGGGSGKVYLLNTCENVDNGGQSLKKVDFKKLALCHVDIYYGYGH